MSIDLDELTHRYVTRSELDGLRQDVRADFNRLNDAITKLVSQIAHAAVLQEKVMLAVESTSHRFENIEEQLTLLSQTVRQFELERIETRAKWKLFFGFKSVYGGILKVLIMVIMFSLVSEGTTDFFHWAKFNIRQAIGL